MPLRSARLGFREQFRRFLRRQFPLYKLAELTTEADLEHSALARLSARTLAARRFGLGCHRRRRRMPCIPMAFSLSG